MEEDNLEKVEVKEMIFSRRIFLVFLFLLFALQVYSATFTVNTLSDTFDGTCDSSNCSIRDAIDAAGGNFQSDTISFAVSGTINLDSSLGCISINLADNKQLLINGANQITFQANGASVFCIYSDEVEIRALTLSGNTGFGEGLVYAQGVQDCVLESLIVQGNGQGGGVYLQSVLNFSIRNSIIRNNQFAGINFLDSVASTVGGIDPVTLQPAPNQIYGNGQEGIVIRDSSFITVSYNYIGTNNTSTGPLTDKPENLLPNGNSGVAIVSSSTGFSSNNSIERNRIAYNRYENVLVSNGNSSQNHIRYNHIYSDRCLSSPLLPPNNGIVITSGADENVVQTNRIECHQYTAVQVVGTGTNDNQILDHDNSTFNTIAGTFSSILRGGDIVVFITNDYNNYGFPTVSSSNPIPAGPSGTSITNNIIEEGTYHGIHSILATGTVIGDNTIRGNGINGILMVGSTGSIGVGSSLNSLPNTIINNGQSGIRVEAHYGSDTSYLNYLDDTDSVVTIRNNTINGNGLVGIFGVDNEADDNQNPAQLNSTNTIGSHPWAKVVQQWFGAVEILDVLNNPITSITAGAIFSANCSNAYQLQTYNGGAWGPTGFVLTNLGTWFYPPYGSLITDDFVDNANNYVNCNPMKVSALSGSLYGVATFSFDGNSSTHPVLPDPGLPFSSPNASKNGRYQIAQVKLLSPTSADVVISGRVTDEKGKGIANVLINVNGGADSSFLTTRTNAFGYYSLKVPAGGTYIVSSSSRRYSFKPSEYVLIAQEDLLDVNFIAVQR